MKIRDLTAADYPALATLVEEFSIYLDLLESGRKRKRNVRKAVKRIDLLSHGGGGFIAEENGRAIGYALYFPSASFGPMERTLSMPDLFVSARHRGKGVGTKLMKALMQKARECRAKSILWTVYDRNPKAMQFYYGLGAQVIRDELVLTIKVPQAGRKLGRSAKVIKSRA